MGKTLSGSTRSGNLESDLKTAKLTQGGEEEVGSPAPSKKADPQQSIVAGFYIRIKTTGVSTLSGSILTPQISPQKLCRSFFWQDLEN